MTENDVRAVPQVDPSSSPHIASAVSPSQSSPAPSPQSHTQSHTLSQSQPQSHPHSPAATSVHSSSVATAGTGAAAGGGFNPPTRAAPGTLTFARSGSAAELLTTGPPSLVRASTADLSAAIAQHVRTSATGPDVGGVPFARAATSADLTGITPTGPRGSPGHEAGSNKLHAPQSTPQFNSNSQAFIEYSGGRLDCRVLVVSVDLDTRSALVQVLQLLGCKSVSECFSVEAVHTVLEPSSAHATPKGSVIVKDPCSVDLVFCDLDLAQSTLEVIHNVVGRDRSGDNSPNHSHSEGVINSLSKKRNLARIPLIVLCEKRFARDRLSAVLDHGAAGYITKPLRIHSIRGAVIRHGGITENSSRPTYSSEQSETGEYEKLHQIGKGAFGVVYVVRRHNTAQHFAQKEIGIKTLDIKSQRRVLTELTLHRSFDCPFLVRAFSAWITGDHACILMEYVQEGALSRRVAECALQKTEIPDASILRWGGQILLGLMYLHQKDVIHRDLKLENVLGPDPLDLVKLTDFGIARQLETSENPMSMMVGTPLNLAPERFNDGEDKSYGIASDFWALGLCLYELAMLFHPFKEPPASASGERGGGSSSSPTPPPAMLVPGVPGQSSGVPVFSRISHSEAPPLPFTRAAVLHRVITGGLLQKNPANRPTGHQLCQDPDISAAIHETLTQCGLLHNAAILEVVSVIKKNKGGVGKIAVPLEDDAVELQQGKGLEESVAPLAIDVEVSSSADEEEPNDLRPPMVRKLVSDASDFPQRIDDLLTELGGEREETRFFKNVAENFHQRIEWHGELVLQFAAGVTLHWSLRFKDPEIEREYQRTRVARFNLHSIVGVAVMVALCAFLGAYQRQELKSNAGSIDDNWEFVTVLGLTCSACLCLLLLAMSFCIQCTRAKQTENARWWGRPLLMELTSMGIVTCMMALPLVLDAILHAYDREGNPPDPFSLGAAVVPMVSVAFAILPRLLPLRWFILVWITLIFCLTFTCLMLFEGQSPEEVVWRSFCIWFLAFTLLMERRVGERGDRYQCFMRVGVIEGGKKTTTAKFRSQKTLSQDEMLNEAAAKAAANAAAAAAASAAAAAQSGNGDLQSPHSSNSPVSPPRRTSVGRSGSNLSYTGSMGGAYGRGIGRSASSLGSYTGGYRKTTSTVSGRSAASLRSRMSRSNSSLVSARTVVSFVSGRHFGASMGLSYKKSGSARSVESETVFDVGKEAQFMDGCSLRLIQKQGSKESWLLNPTRVHVDPDNTSLGAGSFGTVLQGTLYGAPVALKMPKDLGGSTRAGGAGGSTNVHSLSNELRVLRHVWHPNIVRFYGSCIDPGTAGMVVVLELIEGHQLDVFACDGEPHNPTPRMRRQLLLDIAAAIRYLHRQKPIVVHGDLKGSNILVEMWLSGPRAKLLDFGLSRLLTKKATPLGGTVKWMAPEVIRGRQGGPPAPSADVFSFGRLAFMVVVGRRPLLGVPPQKVVEDVQRFHITPLAWPESKSIIPLCEECFTLATKCLTLGALMRPTMSEVYSAVRSWKVAGGSPGTGEPPELEEPEGVTLDKGLQEVCSDHITKRPWAEKLWLLLSTGELTSEEEQNRILLRQLEVAAKQRHRLILRDRLTILPQRVLSVGEFGFVVDARLDGARAAVRVPRGRMKVVTPARTSKLMREIKVLMLIRHPCIVALHGICVEQEMGVVTPVLEWVEGVPLDAFVKSASLGLGRVPVETRQQLLLGIASALWCLHEQQPPIVHGDLKGSNVLVESRAEGPPRPKVLDCGWSRLLAREAKGAGGVGGAARRWWKTNVPNEALVEQGLFGGGNIQVQDQSGTTSGSLPARPRDFLWMAMKWRVARKRRTLVWTAPEVLNNTTIDVDDFLDPSMDVFAFGRICYLVITGHDPLYQSELKQIEEAVKRGSSLSLEWPEAWPGVRQGGPLSQQPAPFPTLTEQNMIVPSLISRGRPMVERCCNPNPLLRPTMDVVYQDIASWIRMGPPRRTTLQTIRSRGTSSSECSPASTSRVSFQDNDRSSRSRSPKNSVHMNNIPSISIFQPEQAEASAMASAVHHPTQTSLASVPESGSSGSESSQDSSEPSSKTSQSQTYHSSSVAESRRASTMTGGSPRSPRSPHRGGRASSPRFFSEDIPLDIPPMCCPLRHHPLTLTSTADEVFCSTCNCRIPISSARWSCSPCRFDLCLDCAAIWQTHQPPSTQRVGMLCP